MKKEDDGDNGELGYKVGDESGDGGAWNCDCGGDEENGERKWMKHWKRMKRWGLSGWLWRLNEERGRIWHDKSLA